MDWAACRKNLLAKEAETDAHLANSLMKSSLKKRRSQEMLALNDDTAGSKITLAYDALRELLEALAILKGYKIYNHECYCAFLKEVMNESTLGDAFDTIRKIRNSINYYGKEVTPGEAKEVLEKIKELTEKTSKLIAKEKPNNS